MNITIEIKPLSETEYDIVVRDKRRKVLDAHLKLESICGYRNWMLDIFDPANSSVDAHIQTESFPESPSPDWQEVFNTLTTTAKNL